ncbi:hypothetical protein CCP2SC5_1040008 [Azospirillaceae bacterium]
MTAEYLEVALRCAATRFGWSKIRTATLGVIVAQARAAGGADAHEMRELLAAACVELNKR